VFKLSGNKAYKEGEYAEACELYTKAIFHNPGNAGFYGNRSASLLMLEQYQKALEDAVKSISLDEGFLKGYLRAAKCHLMLGNPSLSIDYYHKVLERAPGNSQAKSEVNFLLETSKSVDDSLQRAKAAAVKSDFRTAVYYLDRCLEAAPRCLIFQTLRAEALALCQRYEDAHAVCNDILRRDNNNPDALYAKAISYYYQDMQDKANSFFQRALRADPDHHKSRLAMKKSKKLLAMKEMGNMAYRQGHMEEAYHLYSEALTVDPLNTLTNAKLHCNRALVGSKIDKLEESIEDCTKAVELDPNYVKAFQRRAKLCQEAGQHEEAVRDLEKVQRMEPSRENRASLQDGKRQLKLSQRKDYYKLLGISRSATPDEIKKAYRKKAMTHHPDRHASATPEMREKEEVIFKEVSEAYQVLSDSQRKYRYDSGQDLEEHGMGMDIDPTTLFSTMFGGGMGGFSFTGGHGGRGHTFSFGGGPGEYTYMF
jgi:DnaJ family protein C protein 7